MRFLIGLAVGFAAGLVGAIMMAPNQSKANEAGWSEVSGDSGAATDGRHDSMTGFRKAVRTLQDHVNEAMTEAKQASAEAEQEVRARYEQIAKRGNGGKR